MSWLNFGDKLVPGGSPTTLNELPENSYYTLKLSNSGFYLQKENSFELLDKYYGDTLEKSSRILDAYERLDDKMGVLLSGLKGSGKSLLAKHICVTCPNPTIIINRDLPEFTDFINSISSEQRLTIVFDEFEKTFPNNQSKANLLSFLDGMTTSKNLCLLTSNVSGIGDYFHSRPSRIRYAIEYNNLGDEIIKEVCEDLLDEDKRQYIGEIMRICCIAATVNYDLLLELIRECNLYGDPQNFVGFFNMRSENTLYTVAAEDLSENGDYFDSADATHKKEKVSLRSSKILSLSNAYNFEMFHRKYGYYYYSFDPNRDTTEFMEDGSIRLVSHTKSVNPFELKLTRTTPVANKNAFSRV